MKTKIQITLLLLAVVGIYIIYFKGDVFPLWLSICLAFVVADLCIWRTVAILSNNADEMEDFSKALLCLTLLAISLLSSWSLISFLPFIGLGEWLTSAVYAILVTACSINYARSKREDREVRHHEEPHYVT